MQNINKIFVSILAFLIPFPIYWATTLGGLFLVELDPINVTANKTLLGELVPIGIIGFSLFWITLGLKCLSSKSALLKSFLLICFVYMALGGVSPVYKIILSGGLGFLYLFDGITSSDIVERYVKWYLFGCLSFLIVNFVSFIWITTELSNFNPMNYARNFLGFEIYGYLVTFSAVCSLWVGLSFSYLAHLSKISMKIDKYFVFFLLLSILSFWVILVAARKAAALELLFFVTLWVIIVFLQVLPKLRVRLGTLLVFPAVVAAIFLAQAIFSVREVSTEYALVQRGDAYLAIFERLIKSDLQALLFGFDTGFGGYSNIFLDIVARAGIFGVTSYVVVFIYVITNALKIIWIKRICEKKYEFYIFHFSLFLIFSLLVGNTANLNISNPYYVMNLFSILVSFKWISCREKK